MSLTKVIRYVSGVTATYSGSLLDPSWGHKGTLGGPGGQTETSSNQKISLTKVVRYAKVMGKKSLL